MWFVLEGLETMPADALASAGGALVAGLKRIMPGCEIRTSTIAAA
jgi:DNA/RNA-binding domain of Phe-tRNA-synthetase-like protein